MHDFARPNAESAPSAAATFDPRDDFEARSDASDKPPKPIAPACSAVRLEQDGFIGPLVTGTPSSLSNSTRNRLPLAAPDPPSHSKKSLTCLSHLSNLAKAITRYNRCLDRLESPRFPTSFFQATAHPLIPPDLYNTPSINLNAAGVFEWPS
jgi:hypothetical protein